MSARPFLWIHAVIKAGILLGFAGYISFLVKSDALLLYIAPGMTPFVKLAAIALAVVGVYQLYEAFRQYRGEPPSCDCEDEGHSHEPSRSVFKNLLFYGLFAVPLVLGFLLPDASPGTDPHHEHAVQRTQPPTKP